MQDFAFFLLITLLSYSIGALPFGYWIGLLWKVDVRKTGSKNIGATNVTRVAGKYAGSIVYCLDIAKGFVAAFLAFKLTAANQNLNPHFLPYYHRLLLIIAFSPIVGHMYSVFLKFNGGKGIAASAGVLLFLTPLPLLFSLIVFFFAFFFTKIVSVGSLCASLAYPLFFYLTIHPNAPLNPLFFWSPNKLSLQLLQKYFLFSLLLILALILLLVFQHKSNIKRLFLKKELSFSPNK